MKLVILSDTHGCHPYLDVPDGDILIFAGDMCSYGHGKEAKKFRNWLRELPHKYKVVIAGNHDWPMYKDRGFGDRLFHEDMDVTYLQDASTEIEGIKIYGTPWTPEFLSWAFMYDRGSEKALRTVSRIPNDTNILVTHGPPDCILDNVDGIPVGCADLRDRVKEIKPDFHIFGHIHTQYGVRLIDGTTYVNASITDDYNAKTNECTVMEYE